MKAWLCAALAFLPAQAFALTTDCRDYVSWHDDTLRLEERDLDYVVVSDGRQESFAKTISKRFGHLIDAGVTSDGQEHTFVRDRISGIPVIIVDGMIFMPVCYAWDAKAPKPELAPDKLWFLSKKRWP